MEGIWFVLWGWLSMESAIFWYYSHVSNKRGALNKRATRKIYNRFLIGPNKNIGRYWSISAIIDQYPQVSVNIGKYRSISAAIVQYRQVSVNIGRFRSLSASIGRHRQVSVLSFNIGRYRSILAGIGQYRQVSVTIGRHRSTSASISNSKYRRYLEVSVKIASIVQYLQLCIAQSAHYVTLI